MNNSGLQTKNELWQIAAIGSFEQCAISFRQNSSRKDKLHFCSYKQMISFILGQFYREVSIYRQFSENCYYKMQSIFFANSSSNIKSQRTLASSSFSIFQCHARSATENRDQNMFEIKRKKFEQHNLRIHFTIRLTYTYSDSDLNFLF